MGNHPVLDLMVISPSENTFSVDVKGLYKKNFWVVSPKRQQTSLYYVLAFVPENDRNRFFILTQAEVNAEVPAHLERIRANRTQKGLSVEKVGVMAGLPWSFAEKFEDQWEKLPS
jgi:hypothetical protein